MPAPLPAEFKLPSGKPVFLLLDLDGTLAPIRKNPADVRLSKRTHAMLKRLIRKGIKVIVISGRPVPFLKKTLPKKVPFIGEHGARPLNPKQQRMMERTRKDLDALCKAWPGTLLEVKSSALAVHYRNVPKKKQAAFVTTLRAGFRTWGVRVLEGRKVFELLFSTGSKKTEAQKLLRRHSKAFFVAFGDDVTDERVFSAVNRAGGVSIRVGNKRQPTCARFFLPSVGATHTLLKKMAANR
ncbi:trehalose-phosphatase [Candidatus Micrarchaeota archaeon]|nr:trehalose-phosphatase [Candidatus Micrarchaeota archaeon]